MKKLILLILILAVSVLYAQQVNYTWGQNAAGTAYVQTGSQDADSSSTINLVFDMQDFYLNDPMPMFSDDSVVTLSSSRMYFGTLWFRLDAENADDSSNFYIGSKAGNLVYHPNDESRINATNVNWSTTFTAIADKSKQTG